MTNDDIDGEPTFDEPPRRAPAMSDEQGLAPAPAGGGLAAGFEGPVEFAEALRTALAHAVAHSTRRLCWCDDDFAAWPLGENGWISALTTWARVGGRELVMVARDYVPIERLHPRFAGWRRDFSHVVRCLVPEEPNTVVLPSLWIGSDDQVLRVFDREHWRGRSGFDRMDRQRAREEFDAITQRAAPGFATSTLGL